MSKSQGPVFDKDYKQRRNPYKRGHKKFQVTAIIFLVFVLGIWLLIFVLR